MTLDPIFPPTTEWLPSIPILIPITAEDWTFTLYRSKGTLDLIALSSAEGGGIDSENIDWCESLCVSKTALLLLQCLKEPQITKTILRKKSIPGGLIHLASKTYYGATVIETVWHWHKAWCIDQWSRIKSPEMNPHVFGQKIFDKGAKATQCIKDNLFNRWCWENWITTCKWMKLDLYLMLYAKINFKWFKSLNVIISVIIKS